jgi:uncharacterized membrane protein YagU involved in acid resistance
MPSPLGTSRGTAPQGRLRAVLWGGLLCGALDITAAFVIYGAMGLRPARLLQGIASGLLGHRAYSGGPATALLGFLLEFVISCGAAAVYVLASRIMTFLTRHAIVSGLLFGVAVYYFMQLVVLPLSAYARRPFSLEITLIGIAIHMVCVGLPIALAARRFASR